MMIHELICSNFLKTNLLRYRFLYISYVCIYKEHYDIDIDLLQEIPPSLPLADPSISTPPFPCCSLLTHLRTLAHCRPGIILGSETSSSSSSSSCVGDPGMKRDGLRVAFEAWNFCNEVGTKAPSMGSPRVADCFDLSSSSTNKLDGGGYHLNHKVTEADNRLGVGNSFPGLSRKALHDPDLYAAEKELYLGTLCQVIQNLTNPWQFWMIMLTMVFHLSIFTAPKPPIAITDPKPVLSLSPPLSNFIVQTPSPPEST
ncbi:hypothetical protein L6452_30673 [Arctium lappa]|uniref:Uncharacterized protein n=1 Tax=Arctium lappa TaxID=4217 RepID=A0ACB8ZIU4_ARCLA|nr:hypothetical protein L6452_30673 [Arctium lappa]